LPKQAAAKSIGVNTKRRKIAATITGSRNYAPSATLMRCETLGEHSLSFSETNKIGLNHDTFNVPNHREICHEGILDGELDVEPDTDLEDKTAASYRSVGESDQEYHAPHASQRKLPQVPCKRQIHTVTYQERPYDVYSLPPSPSFVLDEEPTVDQDITVRADTDVAEHVQSEDANAPTFVVTHGLPATPRPCPISDRPLLPRSSEPSINVSLLNLNTPARLPTMQHSPEILNYSVVVSEAPPTSKEPKTFFKLERLRKELLVEILSCFEPGSTTSAKYDDLLELLEQFRGEELEQSKLDVEGKALKEDAALQIWIQILKRFSNFRRETGFDGNRDGWSAYTMKLDMPEKLPASLCFAEMQRFMARLRESNDDVDAEQLGETVAPYLWRLAGAPDWVSLEAWTHWLCAFCTELFIWFI
jgi:hypothetical protein